MLIEKVDSNKKKTYTIDSQKFTGKENLFAQSYTNFIIPKLLKDQTFMSNIKSKDDFSLAIFA
jgi:hypothetical protein